MQDTWLTVEQVQVPDDIDPEPLQIVESLDDAGQITEAIAVRVGETARIGLVDDGGPPLNGIAPQRHPSTPMTSR